MKVPSNMLRAAMHCQGDKDVRFYLNGVHIKNKYIEATNGHVAVRMKMEKSCRKDVIVSFKSKIPAAAVSTVLILKGETIAKHYDVNDQLLAVSVIEIIVGKFPDISKVIKKESKATAEIGVNPNYIALWSKMFKQRIPSAKMTFNGKSSAINMTALCGIVNHDYGNPILIVMPTRISSD